MSFSATLINLEIIILSEVSRKPISYHITYYVESKKNIQMNLQNRDSQT